MTRHVWRAASVALAFHLPPAAATPVALEMMPWPASRECTHCITLQFGTLEMHLPSTLVGRVLVSAGELAHLHLIPTDADIRGSLFFSASRATDLTGKYRAFITLSNEIANAQRFFDRLGKPASPPDPWATIRKVEHVDTALRYTKASKGNIHAYWLQSAPPSTQYVYFVIDGQPTVYSITGALTPALYDAILSNLRVVPEP